MKSKECVKKLEKNSVEYQQALNLRYKSFYDALHLPRNMVADEREDACAHYACFVEGKVINYARMFVFAKSAAEFSEIVIDYASSGGIEYGRILIQAMIDLCCDQSIKEIFIYSPRDFTEFYEEIGFESSEWEFLSRRTKMVYVPMVMSIHESK